MVPFAFNGIYPSESELSMTNTINLASTGYVVDTSTAVEIFNEMGYIISRYDLAKLAATLGTICGLDGPLPVGEIVALVAGVAIISYYVYDYYSNRNQVCSELNEYFDSNASYMAFQTITASYAYAIQKKDRI